MPIQVEGKVQVTEVGTFYTGVKVFINEFFLNKTRSRGRILVSM